MRVTLHLTRRCNLKCTYCYAECLTKESPNTPSLDMSKEVARRGVDLALAHSQERIQIGFFGGEPTLRLDLIEEIAAYAKEHGKKQNKRVAFEITTNGTLVTPKFVAILKRFGIMLAVSIDGPAHVHNTHRKLAGGKGAFTHLEANLDMLLSEVPWTVAYSVVTPQTVSYLNESTRYLVQRGFKILVVWPDQSANWTFAEARILSKQLKKLASFYLRTVQNKDKTYLSLFDSAIRSHIRGGDKADCGAGETHLSVSPSGRVYPCVQFVGDETDARFVLGDVWNGLDQKKFQQSLPRLSGRSSECDPCQIKERCASRCPCANLTATGEPDQVSPIQCAVQRMVIPLADEVAERLYREKNELFIHKHYNRLYPVAHCLETMAHKEAR